MELFREALVAIGNADSGVRTLCGGETSGNIKAWKSIAELRDIGIGYQIVDESQTGQSGEQREVEVQFSCFAKTIGEAEALAARVQSEGATGMYTQPNFLAEGVDACPIRFYGGRDTSDLEESDGRKVVRYDIFGLFEVKVS